MYFSHYSIMITFVYQKKIIFRIVYINSKLLVHSFSLFLVKNVSIFALASYMLARGANLQVYTF